MSHNIRWGTYKENVNKKKVATEWNSFIQEANRGESSSGLPNPIRWLDVVCNSYKEAEDYIKEHDSGWYDQLAVKFRSNEGLPRSEKTKALEEKVNEYYTDYCTKKDFYFTGAKSSFRGCHNCGSKIAMNYLKTNKCPVCHADLRPESAIEAEKAAYDRWQKALKKLDEEKNKPRKGTKICWLVKIEYHT